jgi:cell division inhibitor SepF
VRFLQWNEVVAVAGSDHHGLEPELERRGGAFERFLNLLGIETVEEEIREEEPAVALGPVHTRERRETRAKVVTLPNPTGAPNAKIILMEPLGFDEVKTITDYIRNKQAVIVNLEETEHAVARRIVDFLSGAIYALDGATQKVSEGIFMFTPANVEVAVALRSEPPGTPRNKPYPDSGGSKYPPYPYRNDPKR